LEKSILTLVVKFSCKIKKQGRHHLNGVNITPESGKKLGKKRHHLNGVNITPDMVLKQHLFLVLATLALVFGVN
jgi:hypothetical protein